MPSRVQEGVGDEACGREELAYLVLNRHVATTVPRNRESSRLVGSLSIDRTAYSIPSAPKNSSDTVWPYPPVSTGVRPPAELGKVEDAESRWGSTTSPYSRHRETSARESRGAVSLRDGGCEQLPALGREHGPWDLGTQRKRGR